MPRIDLQVPFAEKEDAKLLGARWDAEKKVWYTLSEQDASRIVLHRVADFFEGNSGSYSDGVDLFDCMRQT
jgi:hypothetical protein